jgi:hypothetical protein
LITMFNVLANFEYNDLKDILKKLYDSMWPNDVCIPTFFNSKTEEWLAELYKKNPKFIHYTLGLYNNRETIEWLVWSFADRYKIYPDEVQYSVSIENDGRDYIDISLYIDKDTVLTIEDSKWNYNKIKAKEIYKEENWYVAFNILKSYRMSYRKMKDLLTEVWFEIEDTLYSHNDIISDVIMAPIIHKKK